MTRTDLTPVFTLTRLVLLSISIDTHYFILILSSETVEDAGQHGS